MDADAQEAYSRGYALIGQLVYRGVRSEDLASLREDPALWSALPRRGDEIDLDDLATEHHALFDRTVYPHEGVFLDPRAVVGATANRLVDLLFERGLSDVQNAPDHLGHELRALAELCAAHDSEGAHRLLHEHVLRWIAPVTTAITAHGSPFYGAVVGLLLDLLEHHATATVAPVVPATEMPKPWVLDADDRLDDLIAALLTPIISGGLVTTPDLTRIGKAHRLPSGFGPRKLVLKNLFRAAADFDVSDELLGSLAELFDEMATAYRRWSNAHPPLSPAAAPWLARAEHTAQQLRALQRQTRGSVVG